jgi:glycosyltransferase involved in cell wall biosynthesis
MAYRLVPPFVPPRRVHHAMTQTIDIPSGGETIVVVPCYNEARRLDLTAFDDFLGQFAGISLLVVDDGSADDTPLLIEQLRQRHPQQVATLRLSSNVGKAEAVRRGVQLALRRRPAMVGYWDADLATPLETIPRFQALLRERPELVLVMGSRVALLGRQIRRRWNRHLLGRAFATAASLVLGLPVYDTQCGAKLFRVTPATIDLFRQPFRTRWVFDVEILARMVVSTRHESQRPAHELIYEYPLEQWHDVRGSRLKSRDFVTAGFDLAAIYRRYTLRRLWRAEAGRPSELQHPASNIRHRDAA